MQKHFVTFMSPGTFVAETTTKEIESWDIDKAIEMSKGIVERHNAKPYGFYFTTRARGENNLDSRVIDESPMYYLGGVVRTADELEEENNPEYRILIENMRSNGWKRVIINNNSYEWVQPLMDSDVVLEYNSSI